MKMKQYVLNFAEHVLHIRVSKESCYSVREEEVLLRNKKQAAIAAYMIYGINMSWLIFIIVLKAKQNRI